MGWSFSCPPTAWHCFLKGTYNTYTLSQDGLIVFFHFTVAHCSSLSPGTRLHFHSSSNIEWREAEDLESAEEDSADEEQSRFLKVR